MQIRTDLAVEAHAHLGGKVSGVTSEQEQRGDIVITRVSINNKAAAKCMGKEMGRYITLDMPFIANQSPEQLTETARVTADELKNIAGEAHKILIIGLGNRRMTPDSLGPKTLESVLVTRHIKRELPDFLSESAAEICAFAPGVLGVTGIETAEMVRGVVDEVRPDLIIAIDSLASRMTSRIGASVQISDAGISPGSGMGNRRKSLNSASLGAKVIAIGVPMVTYAATIAGDLLESALGSSADEAENILLMKRVLRQRGGDLVVTPKEIDTLSDKTARQLALAIDMASGNEEDIDILRQLV